MLSNRPRRNLYMNEKKYVAKLFNLHLSDLQEGLKPDLPSGLDYKKAITDYLREIGKVNVKRFSITLTISFDDTIFIYLFIYLFISIYIVDQKDCWRELA